MNRSLSVLSLLCCYVLAASVSRVEAGSGVFRLSSGYDIPVVAQGTHGTTGESLEQLLTAALDSGLKHIDTAYNYNNEQFIGNVLNKWFKKGGKREDIFITSKLPYFGNRAGLVENYVKVSLEKLGLQYLDLYLMHAPFGVQKNGSYDVAYNKDGTVALDLEVDHLAIWKEMEKQVKAGRIKSIGLSNFNETQISKILKTAEIKPSNLQIEVHLYHQQKAIRDFCKKNGIIVSAYSAIGSPGARETLRPEKNLNDFPNPLSLPIVKEIAERHNKTTAQVLLRHTVQGGAVIIAKSHKIDHVKSNLDVVNFELSDDEMKKLDALDKGDHGKIFNYKFYPGIEKHPEFPFGDA